MVFGGTGSVERTTCWYLEEHDMSKSLFFQRYFKNGWLRGALAGYQGDKLLVWVSKCFPFQVDWNKDVAMLMLTMVRMYQSHPSPQNSYTTSCCLWTVVSKSCSVFAARCLACTKFFSYRGVNIKHPSAER